MVHPWLRVALLATVVLAAGLYPADRDAIAAVQQGDQLARERQYSAALAAYALAAGRCPGCALPRLRQGEVYLAQQRYDEAWTAYLSAFRLGAGDRALEGMWQLYAAGEDREFAADALERLLRRYPARGDLWAHRGEVALEAGDTERALAAFDRALSLQIAPSLRQSIHDRLAIVWLERDPPRALEHLREVVQGSDPELARSAERLLLALDALTSGSDPTLSNAKLGEALLRYGDPELAAHYLQRAVTLSPSYVDGHAYLGHVLSILGQAERAEFHLEQAMALDPAYPLPRYFAGMHYVRKGWLYTGRDYLLAAHDLDLLDPAICAAVADTHLRAEQADYATAERWLHAAVDRAPNDVRFHLLLAHLYVDYMVDPGTRGVAVAGYAAQLDPQNSEAFETLGWAYHLGGRPDAALGPLLRARELSPENARIHLRIGEVYRALGRTKDARAAYQRALDLDWNGPTGERARKALQ